MGLVPSRSSTSRQAGVGGRTYEAGGEAQLLVRAVTVHGNAEQWARFERDFPSVAVLDGPRGVGKFKGATDVAYRQTGIESIVRFQNTTVKDVRELFTWFRYQSDSPKVAILEPGAAHSNVFVMLNTLLEELPPYGHVWLINSFQHRIPKGILDRAYRYSFGLLSEAEMRSFLAEEETLTLDTDYVVTLGSVDRAMEMNTALQHKPAVANWIKAVEESNRDLLMIASRAWEQRHTTLLIAELEAQLAGTTVLEGTIFRRVGKDKVLNAITLLHDGRDPLLSAMGTGFAMMPR